TTIFPTRLNGLQPRTGMNGGRGANSRVRRRVMIVKTCHTIVSCTQKHFWQNEAKMCSSFNGRHKGWGRLEAARHHHALTFRSALNSDTTRPQQQNAALASEGVEFWLPNGVTLLGKFDGEFALVIPTSAGSGTMRFRW